METVIFCILLRGGTGGGVDDQVAARIELPRAGFCNAARDGNAGQLLAALGTETLDFDLCAAGAAEFCAILKGRAASGAICYSNAFLLYMEHNYSQIRFVELCLWPV